MDIYRFFHPHHNPRLHRSALRQQEISELEHAAAELTKALERAQKRAELAPSPPIMPQHFEDIIKATKFAKRSLQTLCGAHEGDSPEQFAKLMRERAGCAGWESWARLVLSLIHI